jgi:hypothetical protein
MTSPAHGAAQQGASAEYQEYLRTNKSPYQMTETEFLEEKWEFKNRTTLEKIEDAFFGGIQNILPKKHKAFALYLRLSYIVTKNEIESHPTVSKCVAVATLGYLAVFFCPQLNGSFVELSRYMPSMNSVAHQQN